MPNCNGRYGSIVNVMLANASKGTANYFWSRNTECLRDVNQSSAFSSSIFEWSLQMF